MPEIKNTFTQGKMNKDLDERIVPNGQYRDAMNIEVTTSEGSNVGTVQNILGNDKLPISVFPNIFWTVPISAPSEVETCIFIASLYCPFGTILSSRSLFILP